MQQPEPTAEEMSELACLSQADEDVFEGLALLSPIEYDRRRESVAKRLGVRVGTLDGEVLKRRPKSHSEETEGGLVLTDPEPWPDAVNLGELLNTIALTIRRFVVVSDESITAITLWILLTYIFDSFGVCPNLGILSPEKRCGKTTLLELTSMLVARPLPTSNCTPAAIFRAVEVFKPTLLIDEADTFLGSHDELRGILNSGHRKSTARVLRTTGDDHTPTVFSTWCPKAIACIGKLPETLMDRSIAISMRRRTASESVDRIQFDRLSDELEPIRRKVARWADDHRMDITSSDPAVPESLDDRAQDNWRPLLSIADFAGGRWPQLARIAALELSGARGEDEESARTLLLADIKAIFKERAVDRIESASLVEDLGKIEEHPWPEWRKGNPITSLQIARLLKPFGIRPKPIRFGSGLARGYELSWFEDAFIRYLPLKTVTPVTTNKTNGLEDSQPVTIGANVTGTENDKSHEISDVTHVTCENGVSEGKGTVWEDEL